jgi:Zn-finger protein
MTTESWKCFRCNLTFKEEQVAEIHKEISAHSVTKIKSVVA